DQAASLAESQPLAQVGERLRPVSREEPVAVRLLARVDLERRGRRQRRPYQEGADGSLDLVDRAAGRQAGLRYRLLLGTARGDTEHHEGGGSHPQQHVYAPGGASPSSTAGSAAASSATPFSRSRSLAVIESSARCRSVSRTISTPAASTSLRSGSI